MHFGICVPAFADFSDPRMLAELARDAETAGWEGFFIWDHIFFDPTFYPMADPWVSLAAVALSTQHMRIGTMITPLARRRPWKLAREAVSVDLLSNGRLILGVGLGDPAQWDFARFGLIFLHDGYWNGVQILPEDWVHESTAPLRPDTRTWETMSDWPDYNGYYKYHWWGINNPDGSYDFYAHGRYDQMIYVAPRKNVVIVRLGQTPEDIPLAAWPLVLHNIVDQMP